MEKPDYGYPSTSDTASGSGSGPTGNSTDKTVVDNAVSKDNGSAPLAAPMAATNAMQVNPHQTSCSGDPGLMKCVAGGVKIHNEGYGSGK